jgi:hypothetical protein
MDIQAAIGIFTVLMAIALHLPYLHGALKRTITPHPFTWSLWTMLTFIIFFAQVADGAGPGAWGTGVVGTICLGIVIASLRNGFDDIRKTDVVLFVSGLGAIPLWLLTNDPTLSVVLVTAVDLIAFAPTYRKSWHKPYEEPVYLYSLNVLRHGLSLCALAHISVTTALFPFTIMLANGFLAVFLLWRRHVIPAPAIISDPDMATPQ